MTEKKKLLARERMQVRIRHTKPMKAVTSLVIALILFGAVAAGTALWHGRDVEIAPQTGDPVLTMDFAGDCMLGRNIASLGRKIGYEHLFDGVRPYFDRADLVFANFESSYHKTGKEYDTWRLAREVAIYSDDDAIDGMIAAGVNMVACANDHANDYREEAICDLIEYLDTKEGICWNGLGVNTENAQEFAMTEVNGLKISFISVTDICHNEARPRSDKPGVNSTSAKNGYTGETYLARIYEASSLSDITVVYLHGGDEREIKACEDVHEMCYDIVDAGADIIIMSHPHILEEVEIYRGRFIIYSAGNLVFDQSSSLSKDSVLIEYTLSDAGEGSFRLIPLRIDGGCPVQTDNPFYLARIRKALLRGLDEDQYTIEGNTILIPAVDVELPDVSGESA